MFAFNRTRGVYLAGRVEVADTLWKRIRGLIGRKQEDFRPGQGLWIAPAESIHTFGMRFAIDVLYLDRKGSVIHVYHALRPNRFGTLKWKARGVLELPAGVLAPSGTRVGDRVDLSPARDAEMV